MLLVPERAVASETGPATTSAPRCASCQAGRRFPIPLAMAFQPIVDLERDGGIFAHEALVRGPEGQGVDWVFARIGEDDLYAFDQACRVTAIEQAAGLRLADTGAMLSINFMPNAVYEPENCIRNTLRAANRTGFPLRSIMFEFTEAEQVRDPGHLRRIVSTYKQMGFTVAIDDFGAGHAGLALLADFQPDVVKLDMGLVRGIGADRARRVIVGGLMRICADLGIRVIAEGVETVEEYRALRDLGVTTLQGHLFAKPSFRALAPVSWPAP